MSGRELDPANDEDFVNILSHNADVVLRKEQARQAPAKVQVGDVRRGKVKEVKVGKGVDIQGPLPGQLSDVESIQIDDLVGKIRLTTRNSVYSLDLADDTKRNRQMALLFLRRGYLDFKDVMPDGFYDGGRHTTFSVDGDRIVPKSVREIIVLHAGMDKGLEKIAGDAQRLLSAIPDVATKIRVLSLFVSNVLGGSETSAQPDTNIEALTQRDIANALKHTQDGFLPIGYINHGLCRHRALLFKYLADRNGIPSRLVRGDTSGAHQWNVVQLNGKFFIVDVMKDPTQLYEEGSDRAKVYRRQGVAKGFRGGFGGKSVGRVD